MSDFIKKADAILKTNQNDLRSVFTKIKILEELNLKVSALLDNNLKKSCQVANLVDNRLTLIVANGSVATQIRFLVPDLLSKFKLDPALKKIQDIQLKVRPAQSSPQTKISPQKMSPLSPGTAEIIREIAQTMADPKLKEVLLRISEHTK